VGGRLIVPSSSTLEGPSLNGHRFFIGPTPAVVYATRFSASKRHVRCLKVLRVHAEIKTQKIKVAFRKKFARGGTVGNADKSR